MFVVCIAVPTAHFVEVPSGTLAQWLYTPKPPDACIHGGRIFSTIAVAEPACCCKPKPGSGQGSQLIEASISLFNTLRLLDP